MDEELSRNYKNAPTKVQAGRVIMFIGCVFFFIAATVDLVNFVLAMAYFNQIDWSDIGVALQTSSLPFLAIFFVFAGVGGICFIRDVGGRMRKFATLAAVVMLILFVIDTVLAIRNLVRGCLNPDTPATEAWITFLVSLLDIQVSGGLYLIGWALTKDFVGD
ncbi:MAG: hypothetical protein K6E59_04515 [Bacilli bacterium]|nr:hypothetical protein [Bacilli bacterium]